MTITTFDTSVHKNILFQILKDIYSDTTISSLLGFKGGTAALLFYQLSRFSVDLDFDLLDPGQEQQVFYRLKRLAEKYGTLKDAKIKRFNLLVVLSYEDQVRQVKIEVNRRAAGSRYDLKTYLGVSMLVMVQEDMCAHKLMAMYERIGKTSRDIYDVWFFLEHRWPVNKGIIKERSGLSFRELLAKCIGRLEQMNNRNILDGLGDLLTSSQKDWARAKLRTETIFLLKARLASER